MTIYDDIKIEKLEYLLDWLNEQDQDDETVKLTKRVEQQIAFLKLPENTR